jgi:hypothetical protein
MEVKSLTIYRGTNQGYIKRALALSILGVHIDLIEYALLPDSQSTIGT